MPCSLQLAISDLQSETCQISGAQTGCEYVTHHPVKDREVTALALVVVLLVAWEGQRVMLLSWMTRPAAAALWVGS